MKKFIAVVVALGVLGLVGAGCQPKAEQPPKPEVKQVLPPPPPPPPPPPAPTPPPEEKKAE